MKAIKADQQNRDREGQEDESSEGAPSYTRIQEKTTIKATDNTSKAIQCLRQLLEQEFRKKMKYIKTEFQLELLKFKNCIAKEVTRSMSQMAYDYKLSGLFKR